MDIKWPIRTRVNTCKEMHIGKSRFNHNYQLIRSKFSVSIWQVFIYSQFLDSFIYPLHLSSCILENLQGWKLHSLTGSLFYSSHGVKAFHYVPYDIFICLFQSIIFCPPTVKSDNWHCLLNDLLLGIGWLLLRSTQNLLFSVGVVKWWNSRKRQIMSDQW